MSHLIKLEVGKWLRSLPSVGSQGGAEAAELLWDGLGC